MHVQIFSGPKQGVAHTGRIDKMASSGKQSKSVRFPKTIDKLCTQQQRDNTTRSRLASEHTHTGSDSVNLTNLRTGRNCVTSHLLTWPPVVLTIVCQVTD